jgi:hypothetical protein
LARPLQTAAAINPITGKARGGATLTVYVTGTTTLANLFEFDDVTPRANPHLLDGTGRTAFRVAAALYDFQFSGLDFTTYMTREIPAGGFQAFNDAEGQPVVVNAGASADGTSLYPARRDHKHDLDRASLFSDAEGQPADVDAGASADGTSAFAARRDHKHALLGGAGGVALLTNVSAGTVNLGDVVVVDQATDNAFSTTTEAFNDRRTAVAQGTIAVSASGSVMLVGRTLVAVQGVVLRGRYLVTDTAAKFARDSGFADGDVRPVGAFAVAITAAPGPGAGSVQAILMGYTTPEKTRKVGMKVTVTPDNSGSGNGFGVAKRRSSTAVQTTDAPKVTDAVWLVGVGDHVMAEGEIPGDWKSGGQVRVQWSMESATTGNVRPKASIAIGTPLGTDMRAQQYNPVIVAPDSAVPAALGQFTETVLTLDMTNAAPHRPFNLFVGRKGATVSEATGDMVIEKLFLEYQGQ